MQLSMDVLYLRAAICAVAGLLVVATAAISAPTGEKPERSISVSGHGEVMGQPDVARINLSVVTQDKDAGKAAAENARISTAVRDALTSKFALAKKDLETFGYSVQPQYDYKVQPPKLIGYQVSNTVRASVRDMAKVGQVVDAAIGAGANSVQGIGFEIENDAAAQNEALVKALNNAREKAELIAETLNVTIGKPISVQETGEGRPIPVYSGARAQAAMAPLETPIEAREVMVTADVTVVFGIQ